MRRGGLPAGLRPRRGRRAARTGRLPLRVLGQHAVVAVVADAEAVVEQVEHVDVADEERQLDQLRVAERLLELRQERLRDVVGVEGRGARVLDGEALTRGQGRRLRDEGQRLVEDVLDVDDVDVGVDAELAVVGVRRREDHELLHAPLQQPARVEAVPEPAERAQDLGAQAHRLEHLDRWPAALPDAAALLERGVVLDGLERRLDLVRGDGDAQRWPSCDRAAYPPGVRGTMGPNGGWDGFAADRHLRARDVVARVPRVRRPRAVDGRDGGAPGRGPSRAPDDHRRRQRRRRLPARAVA